MGACLQCLALFCAANMMPWRLERSSLRRRARFPAAAWRQPARSRDAWVLQARVWETVWRALQEVQLLGEAAGLTLAATYGEMDTSIGLADEEAFRLVACLQRPLPGAARPPP